VNSFNPDGQQKKMMDLGGLAQRFLNHKRKKIIVQ
jgi:hypothetical protein